MALLIVSSKKLSSGLSVTSSWKLKMIPFSFFSQAHKRPSRFETSMFVLQFPLKAGQPCKSPCACVWHRGKRFSLSSLCPQDRLPLLSLQHNGRPDHCLSDAQSPDSSAMPSVSLLRSLHSSVAAQGSEGDRCPLDSNYIVANLCSYVDQQTVKLQEIPEDVPTGEMPRHISCVLERNLVDRAIPGTRCTIIGFVDTFDQTKQVSKARSVDSSEWWIRLR